MGQTFGGKNFGGLPISVSLLFRGNDITKEQKFTNISPSRELHLPMLAISEYQDSQWGRVTDSPLVRCLLSDFIV